MKNLTQSRNLVLSLAMCMFIAEVQANPNDALQLNLSYSMTYDDNLFRLSKGTNANATIGRDSPSEVIKAATTGVSFVKDYGLQHVELRASAINYDYQNFNYLNFTAYNFSGLYKWSFTPRFRGVLAADRQQSITGFEDFKSYNIRNERIANNSRAEVIYELDGAWQLTGSILENSVRNSAVILQQRAFTRQSADIGVKRTFGSGSEAAFRVRHGNGQYTDSVTAQSTFLPTAFNDDENELQLTWMLTAKSRLDARVSYLQKKFNSFGFRNYSGVNADIAVDLGLTKQVDVLLGASRQINDFQTNYSNTSQSNRFFIAPTWRIKEKLALKIRTEYGQRAFDGLVPGFSTINQREDSTQLTRLGVEWQPREQVSISTWLQHEKRHSNYNGFDFATKSVGAAAQLSF